MQVFHLRHSHREGKNPHISKKGLTLANEIGKKLPSFDVVLSSSSVRAIETAIAMGFAITDTINFDDAMPKTTSQDTNQMGYDTFIEYSEKIQSDSRFKDFSMNLVQFLNNKLKLFEKANNVLIISHGGMIEISTIGYLPDIDYSSWGKCVDHCKGVKLVFKNGICQEGSKLDF